MDAERKKLLGLLFFSLPPVVMGFFQFLAVLFFIFFYFFIKSTTITRHGQPSLDDEFFLHWASWPNVDNKIRPRTSKVRWTWSLLAQTDKLQCHALSCFPRFIAIWSRMIGLSACKWKLGCGCAVMVRKAGRPRRRFGCSMWQLRMVHFNTISRITPQLDVLNAQHQHRLCHWIFFGQTSHRFDCLLVWMLTSGLQRWFLWKRKPTRSEFVVLEWSCILLFLAYFRS